MKIGDLILCEGKISELTEISYKTKCGLIFDSSAKVVIPDYEGFVRHLWEWDKEGVPYSNRDLEKLALMYNTPTQQE